MRVHRDEWYQIVGAVHKAIGHEGLSPYACFKQYSICPAGVISPLSLAIWNAYHACGGTSRLRSPAEYYALPSVYLEGVKVIDAELMRLEEYRSGKK